ncbi:hypothetical protein [Butyrivibrio sp. WCD3002]|uniref:hypothetical protein n=1 Tax=Butyrivibrio sp. WCD3002 TaxID=1280676 RepID=UPI00047EB6C0|nr:hypothetical protein [Butyrivibrio sp. WCD3002]
MKIIKKTNRMERLFILAIIGLPIILFWKYVSGVTNFVVGDIASDCIYQTYPDLVHTANRISNGEFEEGFTFLRGLGSVEDAVIKGLSNWVTLFGAKNIAYLCAVR